MSCDAPPLKHDARARLCRKRGFREPVADHLKNLLDALPNDVRDRGAGNDLRRIALMVVRAAGTLMTRARPTHRSAPCHITS